MPTLFISYKRGTAAVAPLIEQLQKAHYRIWFDRDEIKLGDSDWQARIDQGIELSDGVILFMTPTACDSPAVQYEVRKAVELSKSIFPIVVEKLDDYAEALTKVGLSPQQHVEDFTDTEKWDEQIERLLRDLEVQGLRVTRHDRRQYRDPDNPTYLLHQQYLRSVTEQVGYANLANISLEGKAFQFEDIYVDLFSELSISVETSNWHVLDWAISDSRFRIDKEELHGENEFERPKSIQDYIDVGDVYRPESLGLQSPPLESLISQIDNRIITFRKEYPSAEPNQRDFTSKSGEIQNEWHNGVHANVLQLKLQHLASVSQHLVILGSPGSGKSSFLKYLALCLAGDGLDDWSREADLSNLESWTHGATTPIYIQLSHFVSSSYFPSDINSAPTVDHLWQYIQQEILGKDLENYADDLRYDLEYGFALLLFDGLDQIPYPEGQLRERQTQLSSLMNSIRTNFAKCRVIVTSRPYAYEDWALPSFYTTTISELNASQRGRLVLNICRSSGLTQQSSEEILLRFNSYLTTLDPELSRSALFLTLFAVIYIQGDREGLPTRRGALYRELIILLLDRWTSSKLNSPSLTELLGDGSTQDLYDQLAALAYEVHARGGEQPGQVEIDEALLYKHLKPLRRASAAELIPYLSENSGILVSPGQVQDRDIFYFAHRTFQEYLAAVHLVNVAIQSSSFNQVCENITNEPYLWRQPCVLVADVLADTERRSSLWELLDDLIGFSDPLDDVKEYDSRLWTVWLAAVITENHNLPSTRFRRSEKAIIDDLQEKLQLILSVDSSMDSNELDDIRKTLQLLQPKHASIVRVLSDDSTVIGMGILVSEDQVITPAHVVSLALGIPDKQETMPEDELTLDFIASQDRIRVQAAVTGWQPDNDVAVLQLLADAPAEVHPVTLQDNPEYQDANFSVLGFPRNYPDGVLVTGKVQGQLANNRIQLETASSEYSYSFDKSFSGGCVINPDTNQVIGMLVAADASDDYNTAMMISSHRLLQLIGEINTAPALPPDILPRARQLLMPFIATAQDREALLTEAFYLEESPLYYSISREGAPRVFAVRLLKQLIDYGCLSNGEHAVSRFLKVIRIDSDVDRHQEIDELIDALNDFCIDISDQASRTVNPHQVLLIYTTTDVEFANRLKADIADLGYDCIDQDLTAVDENILDTFSTQITFSNFAVVLLSSTSINNDFLSQILQQSREQNKYLIPILLEDLQDTDAFLPFASYQHITVFDREYDDAIEQIKHALSRNAGIQTVETPNEERNPTVFIAYSGSDSDFARRIIDDLNRMGHTCWIDTSAIKGGDEWIQSIAEGINNSYAFIPIVTIDSMNSRWVRDEILWAQQKNKTIIPVIIEDATKESGFFPLISYQGVDFLGQDYASALRNLLTYLPMPPTSELDDTDMASVPTSTPRKLELAYLDRLRLEELLNTEKYTPMGGTSAIRRNLEVGEIFEKVPLSRDDREQQETRQFENAVEEIQSIRRCVLLGEPGGGKTTSMWKLAAELVEMALSDHEAPIPLLVRLGKWTSADQSLRDFIASQLGNLGTHLDTLLSEQRAALLLDGLNELPVSQRQSKYPQVQRFVEQHPNILAVVSCREMDYTVDLGFDRIIIAQFDHMQIREFVQRYLGEEQGQNLFQQLSTRSELIELGKNPYMLLMLTSLYAESGELPSDNHTIVEQFIRTLLQRENVSDDERLQLNRWLSDLAVQIDTKLQTQIAHADALELGGSERLMYLANSASIIETGDSIRFKHQIFQDYYIGRSNFQSEKTRRTIRVFLEGPGDTDSEKKIASDFINSLSQRFDQDESLNFELISSVYSSHESIKPGDCEVVIIILRSRFGTPLPPDQTGTKSNGESYQSSVEWTYLNAQVSSIKSDNPQILIFKSSQEVEIQAGEDWREKLDQQQKLEDFLVSINTEVIEYASLEVFRETFRRALEDVLRYLLTTDHDDSISTEDLDPKINLYIGLSDIETDWVINQSRDVNLYVGSLPFNNSKQISVSEHSQELTVKIKSSNSNITGDTRFTVNTFRDYRAQISIYGSWIGRGAIYADVFENNEVIDTLLLSEFYIEPKSTNDFDKLSLPPMAGSTDPDAIQPDLILRIYAEPINKSGSLLRFYCIANSQYSYLKLDGSAVSYPKLPAYRDVPSAFVDAIVEQFENAVSHYNGTRLRAELNQIGKAIWNEILPPGLRGLYRTITKTDDQQRTFAAVRSILLIVDDAPWLPYELVVPRGMALCEEFEVTRWIDGLGQARRPSLPLSSVYASQDADLNETLPEYETIYWGDDFSVTEPTTNWRLGLQSDTPIYSFQNLLAAGNLKGRSTDIVIGHQDFDWVSYLHQQTERMQAKNPLVVNITVADSGGNVPSEKDIYRQAVESGAAVIIGTWWAVKPSEARVFSQVFYESLYQMKTVGESVFAARQAVKLSGDTTNALSFFAIGDPTATGYPILDAEGYLSIIYHERELESELSIEDQSFDFDIVMRQKPPAQYIGKRHILRPWIDNNFQITVKAMGCDVEYSEEPDDKSENYVRWRVRLHPHEIGQTLLSVTCKSSGGEVFAQLKNILLDIRDLPDEIVKPIMKKSKRTSFQVDLLDSTEYWINDEGRPYGSDAPQDLDIRYLREKAMFMLSQAASTRDLAQVSSGITENIIKLLNDPWWNELSHSTHLSLVDKELRFLWELALHNNNNYWGTQLALGHIPDRTFFVDHRMKIGSADLVVHDKYRDVVPNVSNLLQIGIYDAVEFSLSFLDVNHNPWINLSDLHARKKSHFMYLSTEGDSGKNVLSLVIEEKQIVLTKSMNRPRRLGRKPVILLSVIKPEPSEPIDTAPFIYNLLHLGASAVIAPICSLPSEFAVEFETHLLASLRDANGALTIGTILMETRNHFIKKYDKPLALSYLLFGNPEIELEFTNG